MSGAETFICLSNFAELFRRPDAASAAIGEEPPSALAHLAGYKALVWPEREGAYVLLPSPIVLTAEAQAVLARPAMPPVVGSTGWAEAILRAGAVGRPVRLLYTVLSETVLSIRDRLRHRYPDLDVRGVPDCPPGLIRYWNSKLGGRDLLLSVPESAARLPPSVVCHGLGQAAALLAQRPYGQRFFIKGNFGAGGSAVMPVRGGDSDLAERLAAWSKAVASTKSSHWPRFDDEPLLIETAVGPPDNARSLTVDMSIGEDGAIEMIGAGWQILADGVRYQGIWSAPEDPDEALRHRAEVIGAAVAKRLWSRGYAGCFNLDFVVGSGEDLHLVEINVRRSAPLDQFLLMRRLYGAAWAQQMHLRFLELGDTALGMRKDFAFQPETGGVLQMTKSRHGRHPLLFAAPTSERMAVLIGGA